MYGQVICIRVPVRELTIYSSLGTATERTQRRDVEPSSIEARPEIAVIMIDLCRQARSCSRVVGRVKCWAFAGLDAGVGKGCLAFLLCEFI